MSELQNIGYRTSWQFWHDDHHIIPLRMTAYTLLCSFYVVVFGFMYVYVIYLFAAYKRMPTFQFSLLLCRTDILID